ncbi:DUF1345 domain-containing protein [Micromonospora thermarum]|nr:DUF1345 domain-containing protein [Micromonospora thermarum]
MPDGHPPAAVQLTVMGVVGVVAAAVSAALGMETLAPLIGWDAAALTWLVLVWHKLWPLDAEDTARLSLREDPNRAVRDVLLLVACLASLLAIAFVVTTAHSAPTRMVRDAFGGLGVLSVLLSWFVVHTVFAARYARLYYMDDNGGIEFSQTGPPCYTDFAYLAFTVGATFQVSDTTITSIEMRRTVLRHSMVSYLFGAFVIAAIVNLLVSLPR